MIVSWNSFIIVLVFFLILLVNFHKHLISQFEWFAFGPNEFYYWQTGDMMYL